MERTMSVEDKIRRAEEIYNRRRENEYRTTSTRVNANKDNDIDNKKLNKKLKKMIIQIIVCMLIYLVFHYIINNDYVFSEDFRKKCEEILDYDISFNQTCEAVVNWISTIQETYKGTLSQDIENTEQQKENSSETTENTTNQQKNNEGNNEQENQQIIDNSITEQTTIPSQDSIGGGTDNIPELEENQVIQENLKENISDNQTQQNIENKEIELTEEEQMQKDADEIKAKINFIKPLVGTITSRFGWREPKVSTVSKYHTGIDIAANEGTDIISATNGKVVLASSEGAYGNHLKIQIEDVIIIYAHCLSLSVNEGDEIVQGQKIAEVGSTGNSTGPHLHFEIRREDRYVNPDLILEF